MATFSDAKEFFLIEIENTALWRTKKAQEYPHDRQRNMKANYILLELYDYVEKLSEDHPIFLWWHSPDDEQFKINISHEIRMFGFQNQSEFIEDFVERLGKEISEKLDDFLENYDNEDQLI